MTDAEERLMQAVHDAQALAKILGVVLGDTTDEIDFIYRKIRDNAVDLDSAFGDFCCEVNTEIRDLKAIRLDGANERIQRTVERIDGLMQPKAVAA